MRIDPPPAGDERPMLEAWLDWPRATIRVKCEGLSETDARATPISTSPLMSVAGLVRHLRWVENYWFRVALLGEPDDAPYTVDPANDPDAELRVPDDVTLGQLLDEYDAQCSRSREIAAELPLEHLAKPRRADEPPFSLRWILFHMIEETYRHCGHLDILRELADGAKGE